MKGAIAICLKEMIVEKFGQPKWSEILTNAGFQREPLITLLTDVNDADIMKIIDSTCKTLKLTFNQASDAFGEYWVCTFAPKKYPLYFRGVTSAKELLLKMDEVHDMVTKNMDNAKPPRFEYNWKNDNTLAITYKSSRNMIDLFVGLIKGVGTYYKTPLTVNKISSSRLEVVFR